MFRVLLSSSLAPSSFSLLSLSLSETATSRRHAARTAMSRAISLQFHHTFAGNPIRSTRTPKPDDPLSPDSALTALKSLLLGDAPSPHSLNFKVLPFRKGRPLASTAAGAVAACPVWRLGWFSFADCKGLLAGSETKLTEESLVYLGARAQDDVVFWAIDVSESDGLVEELGRRHLSFVELRTLMVATDWTDAETMGELAVAGHARALLEWHNASQFCGRCGEKTVSMEAGKRRQCPSESCKRRFYPRVDPVVIMLVIDKENDRALLSRQARFVPRMWSCLAGFIEPGESLEEAVKRETWEETGIEVGEAIYHSSQPWPVGPTTMPCQLMVGFFAIAKSFKINVDKEELEDAQWHNREDIKKALKFAEYNKAQSTAAAKVDQMCKGVEKGQSLSADFNVESGELAPMFVPGPFAIAHHLISSWANQTDGSGSQLNNLCGSLSSL